MVGCVSVKWVPLLFPTYKKFRYASGRVEELGFGEPGYNVTAYQINNVRKGEEKGIVSSSQVTHAFDDCNDRTCNYGAAVNQQMMEVAALQTLKFKGFWFPP